MFEDARDMVIRAPRVKFGKVPIELYKRVNRITSRLVLASLLEKAVLCETLEEFQRSLAQAD